MKVLELAYGVESDGEEKGMYYEKLDILFRQITMFRKVNCDLIKSNKHYTSTSLKNDLTQIILIFQVLLI